MKNYILSSVLAFFVTALMYSQSSSSDFNSGDVFLIGNVKYNNYKHINFPRANFIIKKGGIANYKNIKGKKVVITSIDEKRNGKRVATIKLVEPRKFFNSHKYLTVDIDEAIKNKELLTVVD
jgi:hypothetical protein